MLNTETLTLWHHYTGTDGESAWARYSLTGTWYQHTKSTPSQGGLMTANIVKMRIPFGESYIAPNMWEAERAKTPEKQPLAWTVDKGDVICRGSAETRPKGQETGNATVTGTSDNRKGGLPHIYIEGV